MKKLLLMMLLLFSCNQIFAGDGDKNLLLGVGRQWNMINWERQFMNFNIGFELEGKYHNAWEIYIDITSKYKGCKSCKISNYKSYDYNSFGGGVAYKSVIIRGKNSNLRWKAGIDVGANIEQRFQTSIDLGLEYSYTFSNDMQLYILQKNDIVFFNKHIFQNGLVVGLKIPLN